MESNVVEKELPDQPVLGKRFKTSMAAISEDIGRGYGEIFGYIGKVGAVPSGPPMALYFDMDMKMDDIDMEACVPIVGEIPGEGDVSGHVLPGGRFISLLYRGPYDGVGPAYETLMSYMQEKGLKPAGPSREIYLTDPSQVESPADNLTEIVFPVT